MLCRVLARAVRCICEAIGGLRTLGVSGKRSGYLIDLSDDPKPGLVIVIEQPKPITQPQTPGLTIDVTPNDAEDE